MARVKRGKIKSTRHKKILKATRGFRGTKSKLVRVAKEASLHAGDYAFSGRKQRKRQKRSLWISKLNGSLKSFDISYNRFIQGVKRSQIELDRKMLADLAASDEKTFKAIVEKAKSKPQKS